MPKAFPIEFRRDVVAVARKGKASLSQVAKDSGEDAHADAALVQVVGDDQDMPLFVDQIAVYSPASGLTGW